MGGGAAGRERMRTMAGDELSGTGASRLEVLAAIILGLATVAAGWGAYQATRWGGVQATAYTEAGLASTEAAKSFQLADAKLNLDQTLFVEWALAVDRGDDAVALYLSDDLFSFELGTALDTWLASDDDAPTPFDTEAYVLEELAEGEAFEEESILQTRRGGDANQTGDAYVLMTVILTSALFFAGISTVLKSDRVRYALLGGGAVLFVVATGTMLTFPIP